jgi:peptide/nickel transport system ATP-binding protein
MCDRIVVFYAGEVVEVADKHAIVGRPLHPYTEALLRVGSPKSRTGELESIPGQPPAVGVELSGCRFAERCPYAVDDCRSGPVALRELSEGRWVRCVRADEIALVGGELVDA